jgi:hypothetical protein
MSNIEMLKQRLLNAGTNKDAAEELKTNYEKVITIRKLARLYHTNEASISLILKENGIKIGNYKHRKSNRKHILNEDFFHDLSSPQAAYWFGFLLADGYLNKNGYIGLDIKDFEHLEKLKSIIGPTLPIYKRVVKNSKRNLKWNDSVIYYMHISSVKLVEAIKLIGMTERKSQREIFPTQINDDMLNIFCRGYFDGDGGFSHCKGQTTFNIRGSKGFLKKYLYIMAENCPLVSINKEISFESGAHRIQFNGNNISKQMVKWLYKDVIDNEGNNLYLNRKYEIVKRILSDKND